MNTFKIGDNVKTSDGKHINGKVKYIACYGATATGRKNGNIKCSRSKCNHKAKEYVWVMWPSKLTTTSYHCKEIQLSQNKSVEGPIGNKEIQTPKEIIEKVIEKKNTSNIEFWRRYNGFSKLKVDRAGRPFIYDVEPHSNPIKEGKMDWDSYNGFASRKM